MKAPSKALGVAVTAFAVIGLSAGTWASAYAASPHSSTHAKAHAPKAKGSVVFSDIQFPGTLNVLQDNSVVVLENQQFIFSPGLVVFNQKGKLSAQNATAIPSLKNGGITKDGKTYTFHLRHDLYWSNGKQETSADYKFGYAVEMNKNSGPYCLNSCDVVSRVDTPNKYTIVYHLKHVFAPFLSNLEFPGVFPRAWSGAWSSGDSAAAANKIFNDSTWNYETSSFPTDGPYQVTEFVNQQRVSFKPMKYWKAFPGHPLLSSVTFVGYTDPAGMIADASHKKTDITTDYAFSDLPALNQSKGKAYKILQTPAFFFEHLEFNMDPTWGGGKTNVVSNKNVRLAMALATNRVAEAQSANGISHATAKAVAMNQILVDQPALHFKQPFADPNITGAWDPLANKKHGAWVQPGSKTAIADAKKLIASSPCKGGCTIQLSNTGSPFRQANAAALESMWRTIGITTDYVPTHNPPFYSSYGHGGTLQTGNYQVADIALVGGPDPSGYFGNIDPRKCSRHTKVDADQNSTCANDSKITKFMQAAQNTVDPRVRQKNYNGWQETMIKNAYWIPEYLRLNISTTDGKVTPVSQTPTQTGPFWNVQYWHLTKAA